MKLVAKMIVAVASLTSEEETYENYRLDTRCIANIAVALLEIGENPYGHVRRCIQALESTRDAGHWSDEVWDTSLALKALHLTRHEGGEVKESILRESIRWLCQMQREHPSAHGTRLGGWHDEPWETALAVRALAPFVGSEFDRKEFKLNLRVKHAVQWLISSQDRRGMLLNPQYTALLLLSLIECGIADSQVERARAKAKTFLIRDGKKEIWLKKSEEIWANCLCGIALMETGVNHNNSAVRNCFSWLMDKKQQEKLLSPEYRDYEDIALATRFIYRYLISALAESMGKNITEPEKSKRAIQTFMRISIAAVQELEIEKAMNQRIPRIRRVREGIHIFVWNRDIELIASAIGIISTLVAIFSFFLGR